MTAATASAPRIESSDLHLADLFKDFYSVPDFQREYVWAPENVDRLLQDVYDEFYDEHGHLTTDSEYFIGSVVVCSGHDGTYQLIDGQQRLTTCYLILCAIRDALAETGTSPSDTLQRQIAATSMNPRTGEDVFRYRLALQYDDSDGVLERIAGKDDAVATIPGTTASVRHICAAYAAISEFLSANFDQDPVRLRRFVAAFTHRVKLIRIVTPNLSHALKVFETINDRGVGLNAMDLLKNLLFMKTTSADYPKLKDRWKTLIDRLDGCGEKPLRFLRYFVLSQYDTDASKPLREDEIYAWFVSHANQCGITSDPLGFLDRLVDGSRAYANFVASQDPHGVPNRYLRNIATLSGNARQHFILLLAACHLPTDSFTTLCRQLENLFFCYIITREPTKNFERTFARWSGDLRAVETPNDLEAFISRYIKPDLAQRSKNFNFALLELDQTRIQQYRLRYILAKLTQYLEEHAWQNDADAKLDAFLDKSVHVEHILPASPSPALHAAFDKPEEYGRYSGRLGNLTLLERTINTSVSNGSFAAKVPAFKQSKFLLTRSLAEKPGVGQHTQLNQAVADLPQFDEWNSHAIDARQQVLARLARRVWQIPDSAIVEEVAR
ncbi:MAG: DUF262 domain-containing HNH endonuclease family protein [Chloroflexota bacterium]|nr:DUF262 domain-containing HNH endonuclease family protein [Chloroflexota bacterium]